MMQRFRLSAMRLVIICFTVLPSLCQAQAPVFTITPEDSSITFYVKASVALTGAFIDASWSDLTRSHVLVVRILNVKL